VTTVAAPAGAAPVVAGRRARWSRAVLLFATFVCAACGLVYELALVTLGGYLIGNTVEQASIVLSVFVFAMGIGALAAKRLQRRPVLAFAVIEGALALVGGLSVLALYAAFAWLDLYQPALVVTALAVGTLIGAEIPVLMVLIQRIREQAAGDAVADLFAADYVGALVGGLAFPFLLLPVFGQIEGALVVGAVNVVAATLVVVGVFGRSLERRGRLAVAAAFVAVLAVLGGVAVAAEGVETSARQALFDDPIVHVERSAYQEIVVTESLDLTGRPDVRLFLNGDLQFSSIDEYRYHESLVHPAMAGAHGRVLVLGGGDGLAVREVLRYPDVQEVVNVELDPAVTALATSDRRLVELNDGALSDPRVDVVHEDAFSWLRRGHGAFDVVVADFPDPEDMATAKLYSLELYQLVANALAPGGRLVAQAGSPYFAPDAFWCIEATIAAAGYSVVPYQADVPSFGTWGFVLASRVPTSALALADPPPDGLRYLDAGVLAAATAFPPDRARRPVDVSTLVDPKIVGYERKGWRSY
jgi:spermidine synthase